MKIVAYYRCSTKGQEESGLGLDAQREAVARYATASSGTILGEFTEVESGKNCARPKIAEAIALSKVTGATLVVAKLDRLSRNVAFLSSLMESGAAIVACDMPHANRLTLHIMAAMAEYEALAISERTKAGLVQARKRGSMLGGENPKCRNLTRASMARGRALAHAKQKKKCREFREAIIAVIMEMGPSSLDQIAEKLTKKGYTTYTKKPWNKLNVLNLLRTTLEKGRKKQPRPPKP